MCDAKLFVFFCLKYSQQHYDQDAVSVPATEL